MAETQRSIKVTLLSGDCISFIANDISISENSDLILKTENGDGVAVFSSNQWISAIVVDRTLNDKHNPMLSKPIEEKIYVQGP